MAYPTCLIDFALRGIKSTNSLSTNQEQQWQSKTQPVNRTTNPSQFFMHILIGILIGTPKLSLDQFLILFKLIKTTYLSILDTSFLKINQITLFDPKLSHLNPLKFDLEESHPVLGSALIIHLPHKLDNGQQVSIKIDYSTTHECTALGWLEPSQTASGNHPFLYSQCQAIHARSLLPIQDTPSVKFTYTAIAHSYLPVLFSGRKSGPNSSYGQTETIDRSRIKEWKYEQPVKIPSYLIAIAAGELVYKQMGERTGVWADPVTLEMAYSEFASTTEKFISAAEKIIGVDYDWGTYDLLVLPPSFPYGGMENSNLTFLTPSLLTGDKSLVDVVAHEISHSWFGNNVGCANWGSFWLNEGWTTYLERLILREIHGDAERSFSYIIGRKALGDALQEFKDQPKFQQLEIQYEFGEDPDLAFSSVPYDKGANFLLYLEDVVGGLSIFLPYASDYVKTFKGKSLDTTMWKDHLFKYFENQSQVLSKLKTVDWEAWLHGHGLELPVQPKYDTSLADDAYALAKKWTLARTDQSIEFSPDDIKDFSSNQIVVFLEKLDEEVDCFSKSMIDTMQLNYRFNETKNQEIGLRWYLISLKSSCFCQDAATWVSTKGRMKFARPVYRALFKVEPLLARKTFQENADFYHPICRALLSFIL
ncbi:hypothetical protein PSTT_13351 [Puccinia striiformis]|uniref:Peptidase M1 leukotriene A4 hydrolase/aminopeptidase C-terminal domain-containing protein n=1 Tax=Puccinia striiformis TaxID=27350 RepID=A0A2S4US58_9BASI|nr:hypothetical protein PSTT_13351 [Puccinia striiformis]